VTEVQAVAKYVRISPRKARLVVDHIRGRSVPEARTVLAFSERAAAREISKVLRSAIANAETNPSLLWDGDSLVVSSAFVDEGPTIKRWRARARGRVSRINKRTCHITIKVALPGEAAEAAVAHTREAHVPPTAAPEPVAVEETETEAVAEEEAPEVEAEAHEVEESDESPVEETDEDEEAKD
jgi:large subunit ribosomal protein L22